MNDIYNIMSHHHHQHDPVAISGNLEESIPIIFPTLMDYDHVNPIFLNHLPSPLENYDHHDFHHNNDHVDKRITVGVGVGDTAAHDLSFWDGDDDDHEKASVGTLESLVDQATRLVPTDHVSAITYYDGGNIIKMINDDDDDMISTCYANDIHELLEIEEHRSSKEKQELEKIYAINNELAVEMDNYAEAVEIEHHRASLFTYAAAATTTSTQSSVKRRNKMNQRMEALKRLVPNICHKTDKATIIDQVIEYIRKLHNERDQLMMMMSSYGMNNNMTCPMMIPMSCYMYMQQQQQQQMFMMVGDAQMGMGVDLGSMHTNPIMHPNLSISSYRN